MENTPVSMRKHIAIVGETNAGKSTLLNMLLGQETAIVSDVRGTTTDPVLKTMELIPYGPIALIDTAGTDDTSELGVQRLKKTKRMTERADLLIYAVDSKSGLNEFPKLKKPHVLVFTKCDTIDKSSKNILLDKYPYAVFISDKDNAAVNELKLRIVDELKKQDRDDQTLIGDLLPGKSTVVLVTPIDSAAPKGRLILPQVQVLRDCLDNNMMAYVTKENTLKEALLNIKKVDLVITDSQAFKYVNQIVPHEIPLTSFSMILARKKGDFEQYIEGAKQLSLLNDNDRVLVMEGCTHNTTHEDIGRVKLPKLIKEVIGVNCNFDYYTGYDFPDNLNCYKLILSCGMCMINTCEISSRMEKVKSSGKYVTNYGMALAYLNGILDRALEIFN